jgi:hypothetical protein
MKYFIINSLIYIKGEKGYIGAPGVKGDKGERVID